MDLFKYILDLTFVFAFVCFVDTFKQFTIDFHYYMSIIVRYFVERKDDNK